MNKIDQYINQVINLSTPEKPFWNLEKINQGKEARWNYVDGVMIKSLLDMYSVTQNASFLDFADSFVDFYVNEDGSIKGYDIEAYNLDQINEGKVLFPLYQWTEKEKYRKAIELLATQLEGQPRTKEGNFWHKKIYPNQVWLDGLYMAMPFYMQYDNITSSANQFSTKKHYNDIADQLLGIEKLMKDSETGLYYHGYDESREQFWSDPDSGCSPSFWGRAMGWFLMALVDVLEIMDTQFYYEYREILRIFQNAIESVKKYQNDYGMWSQVLDKPNAEGNYGETSASAMISYAILKGVRLGFLHYSDRKAGVKGFEGIVSSRLEYGREISLEGICLVSGLGGRAKRSGTYEYYISEPVAANDAKGAGPFIMAYSEILSYERENHSFDIPHIKKSDKVVE